MTIKEKKEILKNYIGRLAFNFKNEKPEIVNKKTIIEITNETINEIAERNNCFIDPYDCVYKKL